MVNLPNNFIDETTLQGLIGKTFGGDDSTTLVNQVDNLLFTILPIGILNNSTPVWLTIKARYLDSDDPRFEIGFEALSVREIRSFLAEKLALEEDEYILSQNALNIEPWDDFDTLDLE